MLKPLSEGPHSLAVPTLGLLQEEAASKARTDPSASKEWGLGKQTQGPVIDARVSSLHDLRPFTHLQTELPRQCRQRQLGCRGSACLSAWVPLQLQPPAACPQ